jgi:hypothetical protein
MRRIALTLAVVLLSFGALAWSPIAAWPNVNFDSVPAPASPEPGSPAGDNPCGYQPGDDDIIDAQAPGVVRVWADAPVPDPDPADPALPFYLKQSEICINPGAGSPGADSHEDRYKHTYYLFVKEGQLFVTVTEIGDAAASTTGQAVVYRDGVPEPLTVGTAVTINGGDVLFLANVEAEILNASTTEVARVITSAVIQDEPPGCVGRCWLP